MKQPDIGGGSACLDQALNAENIGMNEWDRVLDRSIDVCLRCKVHNGIDAVSLDELHQNFVIDDVILNEPDLVDDRIQIIFVARIRQSVQHDNRVIWKPRLVPQNEVRPDE